MFSHIRILVNIFLIPYNTQVYEILILELLLVPVGKLLDNEDLKLGPLAAVGLESEGQGVPVLILDLLLGEALVGRLVTVGHAAHAASVLDLRNKDQLPQIANQGHRLCDWARHGKHINPRLANKRNG